MSYRCRCGKMAWPDCLECKGTGRGVCDACEGKGVLSCLECDGRGYHEPWEDEDEDDEGSDWWVRSDCGSCDGKGKRECGACDGLLACEACGGSGSTPHKCGAEP